MSDENPTLVVGVPGETFPGERRVALVPATVRLLTKAGLAVSVEVGAGLQAGFPDAEYTEAGATLVEDRSALFAASDVIVKVRDFGGNLQGFRDDLDLLRDGQIVVAMCDPLSEPQAIQEAAVKNVTIFSLEMVPRITRAQSMDVLSSMATIAGYKAVLLAADTLPRMFPMLMTAAGTVKPARVFIIGVGVAGLQAIATAKRLGAVVQAYDLRPAVREQVESLGGRFVELELDADDSESSGGYARQMDDAFYQKQRELMTRVVAENDVVITTAAIPGKAAPILVTAEMVAGMSAGSVIVDLAAERGGNCELTQPGETVVEQGVTILGPLNLATEIPYHGSEMYARNIVSFLKNLIEDGKFRSADDDEIIRETCVAQGGEVVHPRLRDLLELPPLESPAPEPEPELAEVPASPESTEPTGETNA
jgi:NAD(P) transhydrogenase subunit alpha